MIAWMVAIATFAGEEPAVVHRGCGAVSDIYKGLNDPNDDSDEASDLKSDSQ